MRHRLQPVGAVFQVHKAEQQRNQHECKYVVQGGECQQPLGQRPFGALVMHDHDQDRRGSRHGDGRCGSRVHRRNVEKAQRSVDEQEREQAFGNTARQQPAIVDEPAQIQPAPQFEQDQAEGNIDEDRQLAKHGLVEQAKHAGAKHQPGRDEAGNARQLEYTHEYLPDSESAQQNRAYHHQVGGSERKGRQKNYVIHAGF